MSNVDVNAFLEGLKGILGASAAQQEGARGVINNPVVELPVGCTGKRGGFFIADSVDSLYSWEDPVIAMDGGTYDGIKVKYCGQDPIKRSDKSFSTRKGWMARFEISKVNGRNPVNQVVNIFMKEEFAYRPYLNPQKWSIETDVVTFTSPDDQEPDRLMRIQMVSFDDELISDDIKRKCASIFERLKGLYDTATTSSGIVIKA